MHEPRAGNRGKPRRRRMVGHTLELEGADEIPRHPCGEPALAEAEEPRRITDDIGAEPVDRPQLRRIEREGAALTKLDARHGGDPRLERRLVDRDHVSAEAGQHPAPAAGARTEIEAALA